MGNTEQWIRGLISQGREIWFYKSQLWLQLRAYIMHKYHGECQECIKRGKVRRAKVVHHVNELKQRPDLALSEFYMDGDEQKPNLLPLCQECHNKAHGRICENEYKPQLNKERW